MPNLFGIDIAGLANQHISPGLLKATLTASTPGTRTSGSLTSGTQPTESTSTGRGVVTKYKDSQIDGTLVKVGDRKVLLITKSFNTIINPKAGDKVTIDEQTYSIVNDVTRDPASATYTCQCRK